MNQRSESARHTQNTVAPRGSLSTGIQPITDGEIIAGYLSDASRMVGHADALFRPRCEQELAHLLLKASEQGTPLTIVAQQTSTTGSSVPLGGWILSMEKMVEPAVIQAGQARVSAGLILGEFQEDVAKTGQLYTPDPTSRNECTIGASISCNASGARTFKYGATRPYVEGLRVLLMNGEVLDINRGEVFSDASGRFLIQNLGGDSIELQVPEYTAPRTKNTSGYLPGPSLDLIDLFIGSEGTLGIITEARLKLMPAPEKVISLISFFSCESDGVSFVEKCRNLSRQEGGLSARCLEWFDAGSLDLIRQHVPSFEVPKDGQAAVFSEQECTSEEEESLLEQWFELLSDCDALLDDVIMADSPAQLQSFYKARHSVPAGANEIVASHGMPKVGTDLAVPDAQLRPIMSLYTQAAEQPRALLSQEQQRELIHKFEPSCNEESLDAAWSQAQLPSKLRTITFGHIGDNHLHVNFLPTTAKALAVAQAVYKSLTRSAIAMGGSPSAEHGIGKLKNYAVPWLVGDKAIEQMKTIKAKLDPDNLLSQGNLF